MKMIELTIVLSFPVDPGNYAEEMTEEEIVKTEVEMCKDDPYPFLDLMDNVTGKIVDQPDV